VWFCKETDAFDHVNTTLNNQSNSAQAAVGASSKTPSWLSGYAVFQKAVLPDDYDTQPQWVRQQLNLNDTDMYEIDFPSSH
jgi:hypothetical protein